MRRTATTLLLAACLLAGAAVGCSSGGDPGPAATKTVTATPTPSATPSLSQAETQRLCSLAVAEAAPGWDNWSYGPGWEDDPKTPKICLELVDPQDPTAGNRAYMDALLDGLKMADDPRARQ